MQSNLNKGWATLPVTNSEDWVTWGCSDGGCVDGGCVSGGCVVYPCVVTTTVVGSFVVYAKVGSGISTVVESGNQSNIKPLPVHATSQQKLKRF